MPSAFPPLPFVLPIPWSDPTAAFAALAAEPGAMLLDGGAAGPDRSRHSYIVAAPSGWIVADGRQVQVGGQVEGRVEGRVVAGDPFTALETALRQGAGPAVPGLPPFQGGAVGLFGYGLGAWLERLPEPAAAGLDVPDMAVGLYDTVAAFDHHAGAAWIVSRGAEGRRRAERLAARLASGGVTAGTATGSAGASPTVRRSIAPPGWMADQTPARYRAAVARILDDIAAGDIYQANYTQRFLARLDPAADPWSAYLSLRARTAAPFACFLNLGQGRMLLSASPERFLALEAGGRVETRPIKGTRPRQAEAGADAAAAAALLDSAKDRAENLMIVDLLRNDLSRVALTGSVRVPQLCGLESFRTVHHLVSVVEARLRPGLGPVDLLRATFPGGSVTGAPKIRAMEILAGLEPCRRGPYCGSVAWIGWDGAMDSSIVIRSLVVADGWVQAQAGGGIVADSDPEAEYAESLTKARALLEALDPGMDWPPVGLPAVADRGLAA